MFDRQREQKRAEKSVRDERQWEAAQAVLHGGMSQGEENVYLETARQAPDFLKWQQEYDMDIDALIHRLRREELIDGEWERAQGIIGYTNVEQADGSIMQQAVKRDLPPLMNELGIHMIVTRVRAILNRNVINSYLEEDRILLMLKETMKDIVRNIAINYDRYDLDAGDRDTVVGLVKDIIVPAMYRGKQGWTKKLDSTVSKRVEAFTESNNQQPPKRGLFSGFRQ